MCDELRDEIIEKIKTYDEKTLGFIKRIMNFSEEEINNFERWLTLGFAADCVNELDNTKNKIYIKLE